MRTQIAEIIVRYVSVGNNVMKFAASPSTEMAHAPTKSEMFRFELVEHDGRWTTDRTQKIGHERLD